MAEGFLPQSAIRNPQSKIPLLGGIFLTSAATLTLEICIVRLLSVSQGHHFAFLVVSTALLGAGASGSFLSVVPSLLKRDPLTLLKKGSGLFSVSALLAYLAANQIPFDPARMAFDRWQVFYLVLVYLVFSCPFFFSGLVISSALTLWSPLAGRLYFSDLAGASLGCLLVLGLFRIFGGPGALLFACLMGGAASAVFGEMKGKRGLLPWFWTTFLAVLLFWQPSWVDLRLSPYKGLEAALQFPGARLLETRWSALSRVDVLESPAARTAPGLSLEYLGPLPEQLGITIDGDRLSAITRVQGEPAGAPGLKFFDFLPSSFPYRAHDPRRVLILDPGGGLEVLNALYHGVPEIVAAEANPAVVDLLTARYGDFSGRIYTRRGVEVAAEEGRSYLRRGPRPFDLILLPLSDSLGASATGVSGLTEDHRLTAEAFGEYLRALNPGGFLCFSLYLLPPPRGELRLVSTVRRALERDGKRPGDHLLAFRTWGTFSVLVKRDPLGPRETEALKDFCRRMKFDLVYYPGITAEEANRYNRFSRPVYFEGVGAILTEGEGFYTRYPFDLSPPTDDRPFFHSFFRWKTCQEIYRLAGGKWQILLEGGFLLPAVFALALLLSLLFILLPLLLRRKGEKERAAGAHPALLIYFFALGLGFMFVEISLIEKFILFLGHPLYSVSLVLFSLLVSAGAGSRFSLRLKISTFRGLRGLLLVAGGLVVLSAALYPQTLPLFQGSPPAVRWALTAALILPVGFFLGMPFPVGIRMAGLKNPLWIPWGWCANGCASVCGAVLPVLIAQAWGFQIVFFLAALCYAAAFAAASKWG
jgi:SAM-dependent methyltransferase